MTKETQGGGTKKFLYSGPKQKTSQRDNEWNFTYNNAQKTTSPTDLNLDDVWSIKKNVNATNNKPEPLHLGLQGLDLNVKKNFYSRYGTLKESGNTSSGLNAQTGQNSDSNRTWNHQKSNYSYSYGNASRGSNQSNDASSPHDPKQNSDNRNNTNNRMFNF